jgi:hypothetical protein
MSRTLHPNEGLIMIGRMVDFAILSNDNYLAAGAVHTNRRVYVLPNSIRDAFAAAAPHDS